MAKPSDDTTQDVSSVAGAQLKAYVERIERLMEEVKGLQDDVKDVYAEAKGNGFDVKVLRRIISLRKRDVEERPQSRRRTAAAWARPRPGRSRGRGSRRRRPLRAGAGRSRQSRW